MTIATTIATSVKLEVECPVHADACAYQACGYSVTHAVGSVLGLCEKCGYQIEISNRFGVKYRRMDDPSITLSVEEFERNRP